MLEAAVSSLTFICLTLDWILASASVRPGDGESDRAGGSGWTSAMVTIASWRETSASVVTNWICHRRVGMSCEMAALRRYCRLVRDGYDTARRRLG